MPSLLVSFDVPQNSPGGGEGHVDVVAVVLSCGRPVGDGSTCPPCGVLAPIALLLLVFGVSCGASAACEEDPVTSAKGGVGGISGGQDVLSSGIDCDVAIGL